MARREVSAAMTDDLTILTNEELARRKDEAFKAFQLVSRGKSNRAMENTWAEFAALRDEQARRESD